MWIFFKSTDVYAFLLLICLCQFDFQTQPGTLREFRNTFSFSTGATLSHPRYSEWRSWTSSILIREWPRTPVFLPGESAWTEEPGGLQSVGSQSQTRLRDLTLSSWCSGTTQQYRLGREMGGEFRTWYGGGTHVYF